MSSRALLPERWPHWQPRRVVYEDDDVLVVDKPAGLALQASEHLERSDLKTRLQAWMARRDGQAHHLSLLHPLDREASGLVLVSKRKSANRNLAEQFARGLQRSYLVLVSERGSRSRNARHELASWQPERLSSRDGYACWRLRSIAAKQGLRRELARAGAAIVGDHDGGGPAASRLMLHAESLTFVQPTSGETRRVASPGFLDAWLEGGVDSLPPETGELQRRLGEALDRRYAVAQRGDTTALRVANGAGDGLPGVDVDVYGAFAVVALRSDVAVKAQECVLDAVAALGFDGVYLKLRPKQANVLSDTRRDTVAPPRAVRGHDAPDPLVVLEAGVQYEVRLGDGLSTGLFLDQRANRERIRALAEGKSVLNLFAYHAAFTNAAISGGASRTVSVDSAAPALARAASNLALQHADEDMHQLVRADAQRWLEKHATPAFDVIVLDPPSYSTTKRATFRAARDYPALAAACLHCLLPGGVLLACTNHRGIVPAKFQRQLRQAAELAGREIREMTTLADPTDFPASPGEACHLKSVFVEVAR